MTVDFVTPNVDIGNGAAGISEGLPAMLRLALRQMVATLLLMTPALGHSPAEERGKRFCDANCARCHSVDRVTRPQLGSLRRSGPCMTAIRWKP